MGEPCGFLEGELIKAEGTKSAKALGGSKLGVSPGQCDGALQARRKPEEMTADGGWGEASSPSALATQAPSSWEARLTSHWRPAPPLGYS